ncbi:MAG: S-layer homology domain-containing protein [Clostridia bacterium]|nr:S-layer homology domain-containing protein [Clostridia bacterium]
MKRIVSIIITVAMLMFMLPLQAMAAEDIWLPESQHDETLLKDGMFYLATNTASLEEDESGAYKLRVVRSGDGEEAATVRLEMLDVTANYGKDYKVTLSGSGLFGPGVENKYNSRSLMDQIIEEGVEEDFEQDLAVAGMTEEEIAEAQQKVMEDFAATLSEELGEYAEEHPDRYLSEAADEESASLEDADMTDGSDANEPDANEPDKEEPDEDGASLEAADAEAEPEVEATVLENPVTVRLNDEEYETQSSMSLSDAYEQTTGLTDDWRALSSDGSSVLDVGSLLVDYSMDATDQIVEGLNSAYLDIPFEEGQTERIISIKTLDNSKGQGELIFMLRLVSPQDNVRVSSDYGRCMLTIADDEDWELPTISFAAQSFDAQNGFVDVVIRRDGIITSPTSVRLTTSDGSAQNGRDYSQVDADVDFAFGVSERTVHIPVRSIWLYEQSDFNLTLSDPKNCVLGEADTAVGIIEKDSESFDMSLTVSEPEKTEEYATLEAYAANREGDAIDLSKYYDIYEGGDGKVYMDGSKCCLKADSNGWTDGRYWTRAEWDLRKDILRDGNMSKLTGYSACGIEYNGLKVTVSRNSGGSPQSNLEYWYAPDTEKWYRDRTEYEDLGPDNNSIDHKTYYYWNTSTDVDKQGVTEVRVENSHDLGHWRKQNTLVIEEMKPMLRPFIVSVKISNPDALTYLNNNGDLVSYKDHPMAKTAGELVLGGANIGDNTVIKYVGDYVEVSCDGRFSYIKRLILRDEDGYGYSITPTYPVGTKTASFALDTSALHYMHGLGFITFAKNPDGLSGTVGKFTIEVEMGKIPTNITLDNSDSRGTVEQLYGYGSYNSEQERRRGAIYRGDYVCFMEELNSRYKDSFTASTIWADWDYQENTNMAGYSNKGYLAFDEGATDWRVTMFNNYSAITARPAFDDIDNHVVVRVSDKDKALFDDSKGVFTAATIPGEDGYTDYEVITKTDFEAHQFYELMATPKDADYVAVWTPGNSSVSYSQNTYYHEARSEKGSNIIILTAKAADPTLYAVYGDAFYAALNLSENVEGETWMPAEGAVITVTPEAYAISDEEGSFTTIPFKGVSGCRVIMRTEALGTVNYKYVILRKGVPKPVGTADASINAYQVPLGTVIVPVVNPNTVSIQTASLSDNTGVATTTAAVWTDGMESAKHLYTISATVINDGITYKDTDGVSRIEHVKTVEFWAYDAKDNTPRGKLADDSAVQVTDNKNGTETYYLTMGFDMSEDNLQRYHPGDKLYVRLITDRVKGNGMITDENGNEVESASLQETVYAPVYTGYDLVSAANYTPPELNIDVLDGNLDELFGTLPIFGSLNTTLRLSKLSMSQQKLPNGGISLCLGYRLNTDNDYNSDYATDTGAADGFKATAKKASEWGKTLWNGKKHVIGVGNAGLNPFVGIYLDFGVPAQTSNVLGLVFCGGGMYVGAVGFFKVVIYFPIGPVPAYFGVEGDLISYVNMGFQVTENMRSMEDITAGGDLKSGLNYDFKFKAEVMVRIYVGVGLCGTLGIRGGLSYDMQYIYYPSVKNINPNYHQHGFMLTLNLQIWVDLYWFSIPIPAMQLAHKAYGYYKDIEEGVKTAELSEAEDTGPVMRQSPTPSAWMPDGGKAKLEATLREDSTTTLLENNYPYADPQMIDTGFSLVLVFITTESCFGTNEKGRGDETTLACSVYRYVNDDLTPVENPTWSAPVRIGDAETFKTGDFQPHLENCYFEEGEGVAEILVSWISRKDKKWAEDPNDPTTEEQLEYLRDMEVYTAALKVGHSDVTVLDCQRVTNDDYYNSEPQAVWDIYDKDMEYMVFYQASEPGVKEIAADESVYADFPNEDSRQLLENVSPNRNGAFLMYKTYDVTSGTVTSKTPAGSFMETPINGQNRPVITDLVVRDFVYENAEGNPDHCVLCAYTVDSDENMSTQFDRELYLQIFDDDEGRFYAPIQLTNDPNKAISRPQFTREENLSCYLFWYEQTDVATDETGSLKENGEIQFIDLSDLFTNGLIINDATGTVRVKDKITVSEMRARPEYASLSEEDKASLTDYDYELPVQTVTIPQTDEFEEGPAVASFIPYMDSERNLFIIWIQDLPYVLENEDGSTENVIVSELYASARIADLRETGSAWSRPQRLTYDNKFFDENTPLIYVPSIERYKDTVFAAANRYEYALTTEGGAEPVDSADLVAVHFAFIGSLKPEKISYDCEYPAAGEEVQVTVTIVNDGILKSDGGSYVIRDRINTKTGSFELSGTLESMLPDESADVTFTYTMPEDLSGLDKICFEVTTQEKGFPDESISKVFGDGEDEEAEAIRVGWSAAFTDVETEERDDGFYVTYELTNAGNVTMPAGAVTVKIGDSAEMDTVWAEKPLDTALEPDESAAYTVKLKNVSDDFSSGFRRGFIMAGDAEGNALDNINSSRDIVLTLEHPYNVVVNGNENLPTSGITLKAGETLDLKGDYVGKSLYTSAEVKFATLESGVATVYEGVLYAMEPGETTLVAKVGDYGGTTVIPVKVAASNEGGGGGGGGGGSSAKTSPVTISASTENGAVKADKTNAASGQTVTLTLTPNAGYKAAGVTVTDKSGTAISVTKNADGTYSFTMPASEVTVTPTFVKADETDENACPKDETCPISRFTDASPAAWYHDGVHWALDKGIMNGVGDAFAPDGDTTRAMAVTMLWRMEGSPEAESDVTFADVDSDAWYADAVSWAAENGVVNGTSETTFSPDDPVTREQLAAILYRCANAKGEGFTGAWAFRLDYPDVSEVSEYAYEPLCWMTMHGIMQGMADGTLSPASRATRAQIATMFMRFDAEMAE